MPEISGIAFEYPKILTPEYVRDNGILWNDDDFSFESYREGNIDHYERLFYRKNGKGPEPFTGLLYELYPDGALLGYSFYVSGYHENEEADLYPSGQVKKILKFLQKGTKNSYT